MKKFAKFGVISVLILLGGVAYKVIKTGNVHNSGDSDFDDDFESPEDFEDDEEDSEIMKDEFEGEGYVWSLLADNGDITFTGDCFEFDNYVLNNFIWEKYISSVNVTDKDGGDVLSGSLNCLNNLLLARSFCLETSLYMTSRGFNWDVFLDGFLCNNLDTYDTVLPTNFITGVPYDFKDSLDGKGVNDDESRYNGWICMSVDSDDEDDCLDEDYPLEDDEEECDDEDFCEEGEEGESESEYKEEVEELKDTEDYTKCVWYGKDGECENFVGSFKCIRACDGFEPR